MIKTKTKLILTTIFLIFITIFILFYEVFKGHFDDAISRFKDDIIIAENLADITLKTAKIDETAKGQDFLHNASGDVHVIGKNGNLYIQLDKNFTSSPGPDYHIYFSNNKATITDEEDFNNSTQIELGKLIKGSGASYYKVPSSFGINDIKSITIYCKMFKEYIGSAKF